MDKHGEESDGRAEAYLIFSKVLDAQLSVLRYNLLESHRAALRLDTEDLPLVASRRNSVATSSHSRRESLGGDQALRSTLNAAAAVAVTSIQLNDKVIVPDDPTAPKAPTAPQFYGDMSEDEPEEPPDESNSSEWPPKRSPFFNRTQSAGQSILMDQARRSMSLNSSQSFRKKVSFWEHIEVLEYEGLDQSTQELMRALWKWPTEDDIDQQEEDNILPELTQSGVENRVSTMDAQLMPWVTAPMSRKRLVWDSMALLILSMEVILFPLSAFEQIEAKMTSEEFFIVMDWISAVYWLTDMPLQFFVGFNTHEGKVERRFSRTSMRYIKSWFLLDVLIVTLDWVSLVGFYDGEFLEALRIGKTVRGIRIIRGVRILRLAKLGPFIQHIFDSVHSDLMLLSLKLLCIVVIAFSLNHFIGCMWYLIGTATAADGMESWTTMSGVAERNPGYQYVTALHWSLSNFAIATTRIHAVNEWEHWFGVLVLLVGFVCFASGLSAIARIVSRYYSQESSTVHAEKSLRQFMGDRSISPKMSQRIWSFLRGQKRNRQRLCEHDVVLLKDLPKVLRVELRKDMYVPLLLHHPLFQGMELADPHVIAKICDRGLDFRSVPPLEDVFARSEKANYLYYVISGSLLYHIVRPSRRTNTGVVEVFKGEWVGEGALWFDNWVHFGWLRAKTVCELLLVRIDVFQAVAMKSPSPYLGSAIYKQAWVKRVKDDVRRQEDGVTRLFLNRPSDLGGDKQIIEAMASDAFPDLAKKHDRLLNPSLFATSFSTISTGRSMSMSIVGES